MTKLNMYCLSLYNDDYDRIKELGYLPVGLGSNKFNKKWLSDKSGKNISKKNKFYGEYSFHYWFWKNNLNKINDKDWNGFCAYRRFWGNSEKTLKIDNKKNFLSKPPISWENYEVILGRKIFMDGWTTMKILKHGLKSFLVNPAYILKKNQNLKLHFDSFHGYGKLDKAINELNKKNKSDFRDFMNKNNSFNEGNMFICKSKRIFNEYYSDVFEWMEKCEKIFAFNEGSYGETRIYAFLIERFSSFWFNKYTKVKTWPILFFDIHKEKRFK